jgi:NSS family neurotransmitter:Na+ symporter
VYVLRYLFSGALAFILIWFLFLWLWSIPIILIEYGVGRFTKKSTIESYYKLIGPSYRFIGGFQAFVGFCLG